MKPRLTAVAFLLVPWILLAPTARAQQPPMPAMASDAADQAMTAGMAKMRQDMASAPMTGDADRDFVAMMIPHHQGAIDMAEAELRYGKDPALRRLALGIVAAQRREIARMQGWLAAHRSQ